MSYTNDKRYSLKQIVILLTIAFFLVTVVSYAAVIIPNTFAPGTTISASQVNDNFTALKTAIDPLTSVQTGTASFLALGASPRYSSTATIQVNPSGVGRAAATTGSTDYLVIPITLPDGATITGASFDCYDNDAAADCSAWFYYTGAHTAGSFGANVNTTGASTTTQTVSFPAINSVVDNSLYSYFAYMSLNASTVGAIAPIRFTVTYTYSR